eukprot:m.38851 g.38851  ORF g.38851 m.38851 type:complete len:84 (+) comp10254_c0_seq1:94-345(+)
MIPTFLFFFYVCAFVFVWEGVHSPYHTFSLSIPFLSLLVFQLHLLQLHSSMLLHHLSYSSQPVPLYALAIQCLAALQKFPLIK